MEKLETQGHHTYLKKKTFVKKPKTQGYHVGFFKTINLNYFKLIC